MDIERPDKAILARLSVATQRLSPAMRLSEPFVCIYRRERGVSIRIGRMYQAGDEPPEPGPGWLDGEAGRASPDG
jgi:hypothetical protein